MPEDFKDDVSTFIEPKKTEISVFDRDEHIYKKFFVQEFVLRDRIILLKTISDLLSDLRREIPDLLNAPYDLIGMKIVEISADRLLPIYSKLSGQNEEWLRNNLTVRNEIQIISAILEVNDIPFLLGQINQWMGKLQK